MKQILSEENLPPDLLERATNLPDPQEGHLLEWVMQLQGVLADERVEVVRDVLSDGVLVSTAGSESISRSAATLTEDLRTSLKEVMDDESRYLEQATFVLALDVQNRVHNEVTDLQ